MEVEATCFRPAGGQVGIPVVVLGGKVEIPKYHSCPMHNQTQKSILRGPCKT